MRDVPWEDIFKLRGSAAASEFYEWIQVGIDVYIPHMKYQVKPHPPSWFSAACAAAIAHRNHFFCLCQKNKSSASKVKFRQAINRYKGLLKLPNLHMLIKQKSQLLIRNLALVTFGKLLIVFSTKGKSAIPPVFNGTEVLSSVSDKAKLFAENFSKNSNFDDSFISLPFFPSRTNLKRQKYFCISQDG